MTVKRLMPSAALAVGVTCGIGLFMARMITTEFTPQEKIETLGFEINPVESDLEISIDRKPPELLEKVETPPPPPIIDRGETEKVEVAPIPIEGSPLIIDTPILITSATPFIPADSNPQPVLRFPPVMPSNAQRSGHCDVRFDVNAQGQPMNVTTSYCSETLFKRATIKSVQKWKYRPRIKDGRAVAMTGIMNRVGFKLLDEHGDVISE